MLQQSEENQNQSGENFPVVQKLRANPGGGRSPPPCLFPRMDNLPAPTTRVGTALRVRRFPTLHWGRWPDALRLPNSLLKKNPGGGGSKPILGFECCPQPGCWTTRAGGRSKGGASVTTAQHRENRLVPPVFSLSYDCQREGGRELWASFALLDACRALRLPSVSAVGRSVGRTGSTGPA